RQLLLDRVLGEICFSNLLDEETIKWYRMAADQGSAEGQFQLACHLKMNDKEASELMRLSAEQEYDIAQWALGVYYLNGWHGLKRSKEQAEKWLHYHAARAFPSTWSFPAQVRNPFQLENIRVPNCKFFQPL
ncbi:MAG: sel1 repeat family protein, partial [Candidatus Sabulitectum sp.]|nr:sel1 repeat family protein [Candidatus Sabulitectum sp.]